MIEAKGGLDELRQFNLSRRINRLVNRPAGLILGLIFLLAVTGWVARRTQSRYSAPSREFDFSNSGMSDFHNGAYFPSQAFARGINPYSRQVCEAYPMSRSAPPYSPIVFILHQPWTWLSLPAADVCYFAATWLLLGCLSWFLISIAGRTPPNSAEETPGGLSHLGSFIWLFGLLVVSRPGHITLFTGYFTMQLILGVLLAVHFARTRPWLSGVGILLASGKPTYLIPLVIMLVARRNLKAAMIGLCLSGIAVVVGLGWLASFSDLRTVLEGIGEGQAAFANDPTEAPINTWTRLDAMGLLAKYLAWNPSTTTYLVAMVLMLIPVGISLWRLAPVESSQGGASVSAVLIYVAILVTLYHHSYDALLALSGAAVLVLGGRRLAPELESWQRRCVIILLFVPGLNYVATLRFRDLAGFDNQDVLWMTITAFNGLCLLLGMLILMQPGFRNSPHNPVNSNR